MRDAEQPGVKRPLPPLEPPDGVQNSQEHLLRKVLRVEWIAHAGKDVTVHSGEIETIQLSQRGLVASDSGVDYRALAVNILARAHGTSLPLSPLLTAVQVVAPV